MKLVLFVIHGTILWSDGAGRAPCTRLRQPPASGDQRYRYDGKTDRQIVRDLMRAEGHADDLIDGRMQTLLDDYVTGLHEELRTVRRS